jgi:hypothetical protein
VGAALIHADRQTDMKKLTRAFCDYANAPGILLPSGMWPQCCVVHIYRSCEGNRCILLHEFSSTLVAVTASATSVLWTSLHGMTPQKKSHRHEKLISLKRAQMFLLASVMDRHFICFYCNCSPGIHCNRFHAPKASLSPWAASAGSTCYLTQSER